MDGYKYQMFPFPDDETTEGLLSHIPLLRTSFLVKEFNSFLALVRDRATAEQIVKQFEQDDADELVLLKEENEFLETTLEEKDKEIEQLNKLLEGLESLREALEGELSDLNDQVGKLQAGQNSVDVWNRILAP